MYNTKGNDEINQPGDFPTFIIRTGTPRQILDQDLQEADRADFVVVHLNHATAIGHFSRPVQKHLSDVRESTPTTPGVRASLRLWS